MLRKKVKKEAVGANGGGGAGAMDVDGGGGGVSVKEEIGGDESMVFTSTTEFTSRLEVHVLLLLFCCSYCWFAQCDGMINAPQVQFIAPRGGMRFDVSFC